MTIGLLCSWSVSRQTTKDLNLQAVVPSSQFGLCRKGFSSAASRLGSSRLSLCLDFDRYCVLGEQRDDFSGNRTQRSSKILMNWRVSRTRHQTPKVAFEIRHHRQLLPILCHWQSWSHCALILRQYHRKPAANAKWCRFYNQNCVENIGNGSPVNLQQVVFFPQPLGPTTAVDRCWGFCSSFYVTKLYCLKGNNAALWGYFGVGTRQPRQKPSFDQIWGLL